jgi:hypothetical protein
MKLSEVLGDEIDFMDSHFETPGKEIVKTDMTPDPGSNPLDTVTFDVPLFIRLLEWAKEESQTDMDLHRIAENALRLGTAALSMKDYDSIIISTLPKPGEGKKIEKYSLK